MPRRRPFRFGSPKLTPLQIFFCVLLLLIVVIVIIQIITKNNKKNKNGNLGSGNGNLGDTPTVGGTYTIVNGQFDQNGFMWFGSGQCKVAVNQKTWVIGQPVTVTYKFSGCNNNLKDGPQILNWDSANNRWVSPTVKDSWIGFRFQLNPNAQLTDPSPYDSIAIIHYKYFGTHTEERIDRQSSTYTPPIPQYNLNITTTGTGATGSTVTTDKNGPFDSGTTVVLTANPATGSTFAGWSGDASGTANPLTITMNTNLTVTANFNITPIQSTGFVGLIVNTGVDLGASIAWFPALNSPPQDLRILDPVSPNFFTTCFTQLKDNTLIYGGLNVTSSKSEIYKVTDINNITTTSTLLSSTLPATAEVMSINQILDGSYVMVLGVDRRYDQPEGYAYQSSSLAGPWTQLSNFPNNMSSLIQTKSGTFYYTTLDGILYSSNTLSNTQWTQSPAGIVIYSMSQLNDVSFVGVGNGDDPRYNYIYTSSDTIGWTLQNDKYYCYNISQINIF
jgi:uncharacterized repeat protein (TIGR02543 family)